MENNGYTISPEALKIFNNWIEKHKDNLKEAFDTLLGRNLYKNIKNENKNK